MDFKKIALSFVLAFSVCSLSAQAQSQCSKKCDKAPNEQVEKGKQCDKAGKACDEKAEKTCDKQAGSCCKKQEKACDKSAKSCDKAKKDCKKAQLVAAARSRLSQRRSNSLALKIRKSCRKARLFCCYQNFIVLL